MVILIVLAVIAFGIAGWFFLKGMYLLLKAVYYRTVASEKQIDEAFKTVVLAKDADYKKFESEFDHKMQDFLKN